MNSEILQRRSAFARAAPRYDEVADFQREAGEHLLNKCSRAVTPALVLDAGCGTGHGLQLIARRWPAADTIALDFAEPMLSRVPRKPVTRAVCGDIEQLPLADACVDLVWSSLAIQWCDSGCAAHEFHRVLRTGGHLATTTLGSGTFAEMRRAFLGVDTFCHTHDFIDETDLRSTLASAGFAVLIFQRLEMVRHYPDLHSLLSSVRDLGANRVAARNRRPGLMGKAAWQRFAGNYECMRTTQGLPLTYDTYFILARKADTPNEIS
jgi:malonyl-CoA O-methyltransferase